nr:DNA (cytosine-5-)-methyltransferase [Photobacterium phosphoreum]
MVKDIKKMNDIEEYDRVNFVDIKKDFNTNDYWRKELPANAPKFAEMFSGAGGLALGFVKAGFQPVMNVEFMPAANNTYNININKKYNKKDIKGPIDITIEENKKIIIDKLKKEGVDIITGGFPCQGFSMAGDRVVDDKRNKLYLDLLEIVKVVKPPFIMMENVLGLRTMLEGKVEKKIINDFRNIGYKINLSVLNSADFGVPQNRRRVIFIGNRINKENLFPLPTVEKHKTSGEILSKKMPKNINNHLITNHSYQMIERMSVLKYGESLYKNYSDA